MYRMKRRAARAPWLMALLPVGTATLAQQTLGWPGDHRN